jgi:hypothetical protein
MTMRFHKLGGTLVLFSAIAACTATVAPSVGSGGGSGSGGNSASPQGTASPSSGNTVPATLNLQGAPNYFRFIRLTNEQWANSVQGMLALAAAPDTTNFQAPVSSTTDFTNNELVLDVDDRSWGDFQAGSEALAAQVTASDAILAKVYSGTDAAGFISTMGRRAYRRPLTTAEQSTYATLFSSASTLMGSRSAFAKGASLVIRMMLQSPYFLYRTELGTIGQPLSAYEMAAKLSLWLKNASPSDALLDSASGAGKLDTADGASTAAQTMLADPAAVTVMRRFHGQFFGLDTFASITKAGVPAFNIAIAPELTESSYRFFDKIFSQGLGVKDIFLSTTGFVGPNMAAVYGSGVTAPSSGYTEQPLGANRVGFFTQLPYLMYWGKNAGPDSIHRGVHMNLDVLCATLGPPAMAIPTLPAKQPGETNRQLIDTTTGACGQACHNAMINPMGFAFEHFDGMGQYRDTEKDINGKDLPIDSSGTYTFTDGTKTFKGAPDLMQVLANDEQAHMCYAKKLASYGLQRDVIVADTPLLKTLASTSQSSTGSIKQMILALVKQDAFRTRSGGAK